ncbi:hypothetical protein V6N13_128027 [Hibiscus sabdariffa]|uniref:Uncharacterized protein n=1 Tax=Hibiscus sabdariffa TaxID=183260 RepID=A0ABR1Z8C1_9ROSI
MFSQFEPPSCSLLYHPSHKHPSPFKSSPSLPPNLNPHHDVNLHQALIKLPLPLIITKSSPSLPHVSIEIVNTIASFTHPKVHPHLQSSIINNNTTPHDHCSRPSSSTSHTTTMGGLAPSRSSFTTAQPPT